MSTGSLNRLADELGALDARIADLEEHRKALRSTLAAAGKDVISGDFFDVKVSRYEQFSTAWKTVAEKAGASRQLIAAHTSSSDVVRVTVTARKVRGNEPIAELAGYKRHAGAV